MSLPFSTTHLVPVALKKKLYIFLMETGNVFFFNGNRECTLSVCRYMIYMQGQWISAAA